jgi:hypothetical protein
MIATANHTGFRFRRWLRFRLRTLFVLMTLVAVGLVWNRLTVDRLHKQQQAVAWIEKEGGHITYDYQVDEQGAPQRSAAPPGPEWLRRVFGPQWLVNVVGIYGGSSRLSSDIHHSFFVPRLYFNDGNIEVVNSFPTLRWLSLPDQHAMTDAGLAQVGKLKQLESLQIDGSTEITDAGLSHLTKLGKLTRVSFAGCALKGNGLGHLPCAQIRYLNLTRTRFTDANTFWIASMPQLEHLSLAETQITDDGLAKLSNLPKLTMLDLSKTSVSDAALAQLQSLPSLKHLYLADTKITDHGLSNLYGITQIESLDVSETHISDEGLSSLVDHCPSLRFINLQRTGVSISGAAKLKRLSKLRVAAVNIITLGLIRQLQTMPELQEIDAIQVRGTNIWKQEFAQIMPNCQVHYGRVPNRPMDY